MEHLEGDKVTFGIPPRVEIELTTMNSLEYHPTLGDALALSARLVAAVQGAERFDGGLVSRELLVLAGILRHTLSRLSVQVPEPAPPQAMSRRV